MALGQTASPMKGSIRMFRVASITVYLHWTWLIVAVYGFRSRADAYSSPIWGVAEYLSLFAIVLLHEFGHVLACRQVGGRADQIVLWPLGGIAFVAPPPRPGAWLWSIAAGPLVNVVLLPVTFGLVFLVQFGGVDASADLVHFVNSLAGMNLLLLIFNLLPVYPLDGGQILQSLLWFVIGRAKSLLVVSVIGMVVGLAAIVLALVSGELWWFVMAGFIAFQSFVGFGQARKLARMTEVSRRSGLACPACGSHPPATSAWVCGQCRTAFDMFAQGGICPGCGVAFSGTNCMDCGRSFPLYAWATKTVRQ